MDPKERRILIVTCFGHFMSHFNMLVFPAVVMPLAQRLGAELAVVLQLSFYQYLFFGLGALPWGLAADRWGAKRFMLLFFFGAGACGLAAALVMDSPSLLALALAGIGLFSAIYHPAGLGLISKGVKRVSVGMGYNGMFGNLGLATAPLITGIINWLWGPAGAYIFLAGLNFVGFFIMLFSRLDEPENIDHPGANTEDRRVGPFLILLVAMMLGGVAYRGATVIMPAAFELKCQGIYESLAALGSGWISANLLATSMTSAIFLIGILGQYSGGWVGDRFEARRSYLVYHLLTLPPIFVMAYTQNLALPLLALVYFFFLLGMQPIENTLVARLSPPRLHHSAYGAKFVLTFGVGALAVKMVGYIEKVHGLEAVFPSLGLVSVFLVLSILVLMKATGPVRPIGSD